MNRFRLVVFDLDGTLYRGAEPVPHAVAAVLRLRDEGVLVRYATNNSAATREGTADKLCAMGYPAAPAEVYGSSHAAAALLGERGLRSAFLVGEPGCIGNLRASDVSVINAPEGRATPESDDVADAVVVGICRTFTYTLLDSALQQLLLGAELVATNRDATYPLEAGRLQPGAGSLVAAIEAASGKPAQVAGKPERWMMEAILRDAGVRPEQTLVVGDREDTDIVFGKRNGCATAMVLTGVGTRETAADYVLSDLSELFGSAMDAPR